MNKCLPISDEMERDDDLPDLWERDLEIAERVLAGMSRDRFVRVLNRFSWLVDYCDSDIEAAMCAALCAVVPPAAVRIDDLRCYVWPQFKRVRPFRLDFAIWPEGSAHPEHCVGIECDGAEFHASSQKRARDAWREKKILTDYGVPIIRFSGSDIYRDAIGCARAALERSMEFRRKGIVARAEIIRRGDDGTWPIDQFSADA